MEHGPVGSTVKDVLEFNDFTLSENEYNYALNLINKLDNLTLSAKIPSPASLPALSSSDIEALDFIIATFGNMTAWELRDYTHKYPEWEQYKELFEKKQTKRERIHTEELLSTIPNDPFAVSREHMEASREILTGHFE
jgi:hypothetical protein